MPSPHDSCSSSFTVFSHFSSCQGDTRSHLAPIVLALHRNHPIMPITFPAPVYTPSFPTPDYAPECYLYQFSPNRETSFLDVALLNKIQKPQLPGVRTWLLCSPPPVPVLKGLHVTGMMGAGNIERLWTVRNGYAIYIGRTNKGQQFLLAAPLRWVQDRLRRESQDSWSTYICKILCCL
jgi:hypothetical protein